MVFAQLSVKENLVLGGYTRPAGEVREDIERVLGYFPRLKERITSRAGTLSGGEQQMLAMARALMSRPTLLLLDEPSLGLAPIVCQTIFSTIDAIKAAGTTVLLVEQNASAALKHSDRAYVLETGAVVLQGTAAEVASNARVREAYLGE
jgi:branched-chain amino acid transport system ATP-binding protein